MITSMDSNTLQTWQNKIRQAIQRVNKDYCQNPWIFMTEGDVQCALYSELAKSFVKARKTKVRNGQGKLLYENKYDVLTIPIHAELSFDHRRGSGYVDLSLFDPIDVEVWIKSTKFDRTDCKYPVWDFNWKPSEAIGIEIKFNRWRTKKDAYSNETKRERKTSVWLNYRKSLVTDLKKLKDYKRGWLVFVDQNNLFDSRNDWRDFVEDIIRDSNSGWAKKTLNAYYLAPKFKTALSFKPPDDSY